MPSSGERPLAADELVSMRDKRTGGMWKELLPTQCAEDQKSKNVTDKVEHPHFHSSPLLMLRLDDQVWQGPNQQTMTRVQLP